ncbi:hypothetical protein C0993_010966, partial [Termitomyces sp. T159_Od127]
MPFCSYDPLKTNNFELTFCTTDHGPEATQHLKAFIGDYYASSDEPAFVALWNNYNKCQFVEDE